jgi:predicted Zn-dependent protease
MSARLRATGAALTAAALLITGCAVNPATGKRQLSLISERDEIEMGRQADQEISAALGLYDDDELQAYVQRVGGKLAALSERPHLDWSFRVIDDPTVNAFALPGGYIYVTRGLLAYMNSEAELASVLGHEIGHVTARHSVNQMSKQQLYQLGLGVGMAVSEDVAQFADLAQTGLGVLLLKYSRDDERQADTLGLRYLGSAGYDPRPMPDVFVVLKRVGEARGGDRVPAWLSTHPAPENRAEIITAKIEAQGKSFNGLPINQPAYYSAIDGIVFGPDPREGFFEGPAFYHPGLQFRFEFPAGWRTVNERQFVSGRSPDKDAVIEIAHAQADDTATALREFLAKENVQAGSPWLHRIGGSRASSSAFRATTDQGTLAGLIAFVEFRGQVFRLMGLTQEASWSGYRPTMRDSLSSFAALTDPEILAVEPPRLQVHKTTGAMSLDEFATRNVASVDAQTLAVLNHLQADSRLVAGYSYKLVTGGP